MIKIDNIRCPKCKKSAEGATAITRPGAIPKDGDWTVCVCCASVLRYEYDGKKYGLRELNDEDRESLKSTDARNMAVLDFLTTTLAALKTFNKSFTDHFNSKFN